jgi:hypothetical protein
LPIASTSSTSPSVLRAATRKPAKMSWLTFMNAPVVEPLNALSRGICGRTK